VPTLAQVRHLCRGPASFDNIADAPDFVLISEDKSKIYLVDVKYQNRLNLEKLRKEAAKLLRRWEYHGLFFLSRRPKDSGVALCTSIVDDIANQQSVRAVGHDWAATGIFETAEEFKN